MTAAIRITGTEFVKRGAPIHLVCNDSGRPVPPLNVDWLKDGHVIDSDAEGGVIVTKHLNATRLVSVLAIRRSRMQDGGLYECRSSNADTAQITVTVLAGNLALVSIRSVAL